MLWNVDQMMEDAVSQITRRYNLNKAQENYTRLLLTERVREFLDDYEMDVRELLQQSIDMRANRIDNSPKALMKWAMRAAPLYDAAKNAIIEGNEEWAQILDDEQRKLHDKDMALMKTNFANVQRTLDIWVQGKGTMPGARPSGATPSGGNGGSALAKQENRVSEPVAAVTIAKVEDNWLAYVNTFIKAYKLDDKQQIAAREKIHKEQLARARQYRQNEKKRFQQLDALLAAKDGKANPAELRRRRLALERPIRKMFINLDRRLRALPNSRQRADVDPVLKKQLEQTYKMLAGLSRPVPTAGKIETKLKPDKPQKAQAQSNKEEKKADKTQKASPGQAAPDKPKNKTEPKKKNEPKATVQHPTP